MPLKADYFHYSFEKLPMGQILFHFMKVIATPLLQWLQVDVRGRMFRLLICLHASISVSSFLQTHRKRQNEGKFFNLIAVCIVH